MAFPEVVELEDARLERWDARQHLPALLVMTEDPDVQRFLRLPRDEAGLAAVSERFAGHWAEHGFGLWAVRLPEAGPAGWVGACHPKWHPDFADHVELAWGFTRDARGKGIATAGARAAADGCFAEFVLERLIAFIDPGNAASRAVADRLGMHPAGHTIDPRKDTPLDVLELVAPTVKG